MSRRSFQGRAVMRKAASRRLQDALALLSKAPEHAQGAKYLGGYAIECKLKYIAMEIYDCYTLEELAGKLGLSEDQVFIHGLEKMATRLPGLYRRLKAGWAWIPFARVNQWRPSWRYEPGEATIKAKKSAADFLEDVQTVYNWLETNRG